MCLTPESATSVLTGGVWLRGAACVGRAETGVVAETPGSSLQPLQCCLNALLPRLSEITKAAAHFDLCCFKRLSCGLLLGACVSHHPCPLKADSVSACLVVFLASTLQEDKSDLHLCKDSLTLSGKEETWGIL